MEGYKKLTTYILATVICDLNVEFISKNIDYRSRTRDQMEQAGRSGKHPTQCLLAPEVYVLASQGRICGAGKYCRREWAFRAVWVKPNIPNTPNLPKNPEEAANMLLTFCQMESYLLTKQIAALKEKFIKEGGFRENLFRKRREYIKSKI